MTMRSSKQQIAARNPDDVAGYHKFLSYSKELYREGYEKLGTTAFLKMRQMFAAGPTLIRLRADQLCLFNGQQICEERARASAALIPIAAGWAAIRLRQVPSTRSSMRLSAATASGLPKAARARSSKASSSSLRTSAERCACPPKWPISTRTATASRA